LQISNEEKISKNSKSMIIKGLNSENKKNSMKTIFFKYTLVPIIPLMIIATLAMASYTAIAFVLIRVEMLFLPTAKSDQKTTFGNI